MPAEKSLSPRAPKKKRRGHDDPAPAAPGAAFPVVGVGASAGGLDALRQLLGALPCDTGMAFVIIQHLAPEHASSLSEILARATRMPVCEVRAEPEVEPDHVYVIPPGRDMIITGGKLRLLPQQRHARHRGIDQFFRSLAEDSGHQAIGVVLSGSASDGTLGLEVIKAEGGVTFAQDESAQHDSMPKSAIASGCVDFVLPPAGIATEIARIARHPYVAQPAADKESGDGQPGHARIAEIVRRATGVDFTHYKAATMQRRIHRRMMVHKIETLAQYEEHLRATPGEIEALYQDVLISVTSFFRNPGAFEVVAKKIVPKLLAERSRHDPVRIWTLGCSTGEEAYSLAMIFAECAEAAKSAVQFQLFATDLNASAIEKARAGLYPRSISQDVSPERLRRFFVEEDGHYRICKGIRERCVFSRHNVLADPPFSRIDFISCRNLLIYLEPALQQQVVPQFHYALKPGGHLWLGTSESLGASHALFEIADARQKIFVRKPGPTPLGARFRPAAGGPTFSAPPPGAQQTLPMQLPRDAERVLLAKYAPPGVVVNVRLEVVQFRGETGAYLAPPAGLASYELLKMLREGLLVPVRAALARAGREGRAVREEGARVKSNGGFRELTIEVIPLKAGPGREGGFVILFDEVPAPRADAPPKTKGRKGKGERREEEDEVARLTQELGAMREYLQSVIEQQDAANEELQSANEEAQSANEEMQSVNEELETSKEEIQSSNEELATVNDELNNRNAELNRLNNDLNNVLASTQLSILIVTRDLRIRRFTLVAEKTLNLVAGDVGRPLGDIKLSVAMPELEPLLREVIDTVSPRERDVQDPQGRWFSLRARPYLTHDNMIDGAVVTLVDVNTLRRERDYAQDILAGVRVPLLVLDAALHVKMASRAFYEHFRLAPAETVGRLIYDLGNCQWDFPALRKLLALLPREQAIENVKMCHTFEEIGPRIMLVTGRHLARAPVDEALIILSIEDITERERGEEARARLAAIVETSDDAIIGKNLEGIITSWNAGAERLFGYTAQEILGQPVTVLIPPDRHHEEADILSHIRRGDPVEHFETVRRRKDGTLFDVSLTSSPIVDDQGKIVGVSKIARNITERKQVAEALRRNEALFATIIDQAPGGVYVVDEQFRVMAVNVLARPVFAAAEPIIGRDFTEAIQILWGPEVGKQVASIFRHTLETGEPYASPRFKEKRSDLGVEQSYEWQTRRLTLPSGERGVVCYFTDTTEREQAAEALRVSEERLRLSQEAAYIGSFDLNLETGVNVWTEKLEAMYGLPRGGFPRTQQAWEEMVHPDDRGEALAKVALALKTGEPVESEWRVIWPDGTEHWLAGRFQMFRDAAGKPVRLAGVNLDITERRRLEDALVARAAELARADRSKDEFLAMLAHELRNPLAPLRNAAEILQTPESSAADRAQAERIIGRQIENMSRMLDDLLDVSRITEGKISLRKRPVALEAILTAATSLARSDCAARGQQLTLTLPAEPVWLEGDATRLEQVFGNLLTNACKYSGEGCRIALQAERSDGEVVVRVSDDGIGIDPEMLPRVFDLFVQASRSLDRQHGGLGIGLTLVRRLVNLHGGSITAHSEGLNQGAEFIVRLPILAEVPPSRKPPPVARESPRRILIVDDNSDSARSLALLESRRGHETRAAFTGPEAVAVAAEFLPEVILLDIGLPGMDGFEVARQIRTMPALAGTFLIAMSGYGRDEDRSEARAAGFDKYLVKPVDLDQLRDLLRERS